MSRKCVITGGSSGIGRTIVQTLKREGYSVLGIQRRPPGIQADLRLINNIPAIWKRACEKWDHPPDLVILCAGMPLECPFLQTSTSVLQDLILLNLISPLVLAREALQTWTKTKTAGHLIFIGSQAALPGAKQTGNVAYSASKGGIHACIGPLANEYGPLVRVNGIAPGDVITKTENEIIRKEAIKQGVAFEELKKALDVSSALQRRVKTSEVAQAVLFLDCCPAMTGAIINISAGKSAH